MPQNRPETGLIRNMASTQCKNTLKTIGDQDNWIDSLGEVGVELKAWQAAIIQDMGGEENISAMERSIIDLATKTFLMLQSVDRFLLQQPSLVNKSKRQLFSVVLQRQTPMRWRVIWDSWA